MFLEQTTLDYVYCCDSPILGKCSKSMGTIFKNCKLDYLVSSIWPCDQEKSDPFNPVSA